ncbi:MAG: M48 family metallopeptidase [Bdellovibrionales bacterium]
MNIYFYLIPALIVFGFLWEFLVDYLNTKNLKTEVPEEFQGVYPEADYEKSQKYLKDKSQFGLIQNSLSTVLTLAFFFLGGFAWLQSTVSSYVDSSLHQGVLYIGFMGFASFLIGLPFSYYSTFSIEEKYGFNKMDVKTFLKDNLVGVSLGLVIGAPILYLVLWFFESAGDLAWVYVWVSLTAIQIFMTFLAPVVIMPLFNKFTAIKEGELRTEVNKYAQSQNFELEGLYTMDGSKRSTKANAFFTGFGKFRRVVLFDTLIEKQSTNELVAVLAHEIGHFKKKHIHRQMLVSILQTGIMFFILSIFIKDSQLAAAFGVSTPTVYTGLVFFGFLYSPISMVLGLYSLHLSRKYEFEADEFAARTHKHPEDLSSALKKLSVDSLSNLSPHPLKVFTEYTHPPIIERLKVLNSIKL